MRMKLGKKGWLFEGIMFFIILIILTTAFFSLYKKYGQFPDGYKIGDRQFSLINAYQKGEAALFYIDQSAKYSLGQSVYDLAKSGGVSEIEVSDAETFAGYECGKFNGAYVWYQIRKNGEKHDTKECFGENYAEINLPYIFNKNLNKYLLNYLYNIPKDNYEFKLVGNLEIIGMARLPVNINIFKKEVQEDFSTGTRDVKPKPLDIKQLDKDTTKPSEGFRDFTGTDLCAKGDSCLLTEGAFQLLLKSAEVAVKKGVSLQVTNGYRSKETQKALWEGKTAERYAQKYPDPAVRKRYVSNPDECGNSCVHYSGNAIDIRFKGKTRETMTAKDWKLLEDTLTQTKTSNNQPAWVRYSNEPWHFECCNTPRYSRAVEKGVTSIV